MKLLAIDTTEEACSAALTIDGETRERFEIAPRRHNELILPMMQGLLDEAGLRVRELDAIGFARGPGAFTGLRIAAAVAQGTAMGADLPVVPVSSLAALAQGAWRGHRAGQVLPAFDARMGEVYWGGYRIDAEGLMQSIIDDTVCTPDAVPLPTDDEWVGVGSGWDSYADVLKQKAEVATWFDGLRVHAQDVAALAMAGLLAGQSVDAAQALPVYLRDEVAWARQN